MKGRQQMSEMSENTSLKGKIDSNVPSQLVAIGPQIDIYMSVELLDIVRSASHDASSR